ncbi:unnamed protein product [Pleuronectes platessa]|uniref:Uncharacterized protein n=1 Tax=Pleuronectes platessa TaxID=8262 RepID=A0A9N7UK24_PLEPL|nr:unnamed protein product [Pleuronectes platessa]
MFDSPPRSEAELAAGRGETRRDWREDSESLSSVPRAVSGNANRATPLRGSRPPGFPAIGSSLKVTLQSGHADVAGLAVGMEPAPHNPPTPTTAAAAATTPPPSFSFSPAHPPILPHYPHHHHLKDSAPTPAGPGQRQDPHRLPPREPLSKNSSPQA